MATVQTPPEMSLSASLPVQQEQSEIDLMALTMAALRFVNPWSVEVKPSQWEDQIVPGAPEAKDRTITLAEVRLHDSPQDCWVVIYDRVYDITTFFDEVSSKLISNQPFPFNFRFPISSLLTFTSTCSHKLESKRIFPIVTAPWWSGHNVRVRGS